MIPSLVFFKKDNELDHSIREIYDTLKTSSQKLSGKKELRLEVKTQNLLSEIAAEIYKPRERKKWLNFRQLKPHMHNQNQTSSQVL